MPSRQQISREHIAQQRKIEAEWRNKIFWALRRSKRPFFEMIERGGLPMANAIGPTIIDPVPIRKVLERLYKEVASKEAATAYNEGIRVKAIGFGASASWLSMIEEWFSTFIEKLSADISDTTWANITKIINKGLQDGDSYDIIIRRLRETGQDKKRAALIARTETNKSLGWAKYQAAGKLPYPKMLVWVSATDKRTRGTKPKDKADHRALDGKMVDYGVPFVDPRSGALMLYPGDTTNGAGPGDICNCRCTLTTRRKRDGSARPVLPAINQPTPILSQRDIIEQQRRTIAQKLGFTDDDYNIRFISEKGRILGDVRYVDNGDGKYILGKEITINTDTSENIVETLAHEMRHIWQSKFKGLYITKEGVFWEGNKHISLKAYNTILNAIKKAKDKETWQKATDKYNALPWEKDANEFMKIAMKLYSTKGIVDLIEIPDELLVGIEDT